jgi:hypothetical protein
MRSYGSFIELGLAALVAVAGVFPGAAPGNAAEAPIGSIAAMSPAAVGTLPSGEATPLAAGAGVFFAERLATQDAGRLHLELADHSVLDVAPNSEIVIDKFVYDPSTGAGEIAGRVSQGLLRYVGGAVSKTADAVFTTPSATIAIRGSSMLVEVTSGGETRATFLGGAHMRVTSGGMTREVTRAGFFVGVARPGAAPSAIQRAKKADIERAIGAVKRRPGEQRAALRRPPGPGKATAAHGKAVAPKALQKKPPAKTPPGQEQPPEPKQP